MIIRKLKSEDVGQWRRIRLEALESDPSAFLTQYKDVLALPLSELAEQLETSETFVAFDGDDPVACMGYLHDKRTAVQHRATIIAVYIRQIYRGTGLSNLLMQAVLDDLPEQVLQLHLECAATNPRGIAYYKRHGFEICGTIPRAIFVDGIATDDHVMIRKLD